MIRGLLAGIAAAAVVGGLVWFHQTLVQQTKDKATVASDAAWQKRLDAEHAQALSWRKTAEAAQNKISQEVQAQYAKNLARIHADAVSLRLRGPGKAQACPRPISGANLSISSIGSDTSSWNGDVAGFEVPASNWAAVPWNWLVGRAEQADSNRAEVLAWRDWYKKQSKASADFAQPRQSEPPDLSGG